MKTFAQFLKEGKNAEAIDEVKNSIREQVNAGIEQQRDSILESFKFIKEEKDEKEDEEPMEEEEDNSDNKKKEDKKSEDDDEESDEDEE